MSIFYKTIRSLALIFVMLFSFVLSYGQALTGTKTINPVGGDYPSMFAAIADLNTNGVGTGGVTFNIPAGLIFNEKDSLVITATGTAANPIVFQKSGSGKNPVIAADYAGSYPLGAATTTSFTNHGDAVIKLVGTSYITFNGLTIRDALGKTTNKEKMEYGIYLTKTTSTTTPTYASACKFVSITNCTVILDKNNINNIGIFSADRERQGKTAVNPISATDTTGNLINIIVTGNTVQNCYNGIVLNGSAHVFPTVGTSAVELTSKKKDRNFVISNNTILNYGGGSSIAYAIYNNHISNAYIENNTISGGNFTSNTLYGISVNGGFNSNVNINNNTISLSGMTSTSICIQAAAGAGSVGTTFSSASPSYYFAAGSLTNTVNINGNKLINNKVDNLSGQWTGINPTTAMPLNLNINNNIISNNTKLGRGILLPISIGTRGLNTNVLNNVIRDNKVTADLSSSTTPGFTLLSVGSPLSVSVTQNPLLMQRLLVEGNLMQNNGVEFVGQTTNTASMTGYTSFSNSVTRANQIVRNNTIKGFYVTGNSSGTTSIVGYSVSSTASSSGTVLGTPVANTRFYNNTLDSVYVNTSPEVGQLPTVLPGSGIISGISTSVADTLYMYNNKVSNMYANGINSTVRGILTSSGFVLQIYNNTVSELYAPITRSTANSSVTGMDLTTSSTAGRILVSNNTVYLDNNNTDTLSKHRSAAIYTASSTANSIRLVNNIFVNKSKGNKNTLHVAHTRSSSDFTNMRTTGFLSGRNVYYAGASAAQSKSLYYFAIGSTDSAFTLNQYQSSAIPADTSSFGEDVPFVNVSTRPYNLNLSSSTATFAADRALPISFNANVKVDKDINNATRSTTTPDIGAYEGSYTYRNADFNLPILSYTPVLSPAPMTIFAGTILSATIVDYGSGVNVNTGLKPRLYYRKYKKNTATADNFFTINDKTVGGWKYVEPATISGTTYNFTMDTSKLQNYTQGDSIEYFVIAQDLAATPNISTNKLTVFNAVPTSVDLTAGNFPVKTLGNLFRTAAPFPATITVGAFGGAYPSFTGTGGLFEALNGASINKDLAITVVSNTYETGAVDLTSNAFQTGTYKISIRPAGPTEDSIVGIGTTTTGAMMEFVATKRVTIDGSFNGSGNYLIFANPIANPGLRFTPTSTLSCDSITVKNCVFIGTPNNTTSYGILAVGNTATGYTTLTNAKHKNIVVKNNIFKRITVGVYLSNAATSAYMTGVSVSNNSFGAAEAPLRTTGIHLGYTRGAVVDSNSMEYLYSNTVTAINATFSKQLKVRRNTITNKNVSPQSLLGSNTLVGINLTEVDSSKILYNKVSDQINTGTGNTGITLNSNVKNSLIAFNQIYNLFYTGSGGWSGYGMKISTGTGNSANDTIFANTIARVGGDGWSSIAAGGTAGFYVSSADSMYFYNNTVNLIGFNRRAALNVSAAIDFESSCTKIRVQNNIFVNKLTNPLFADSRSMGIIWLGAATELRKLNNNLYFTDQGAQGVMSRMRLANQASDSFTDFKAIVPHVLATQKDSASLFIEPMFVDSMDLHIASLGTPVVMESKGVTFSNVVNSDIDGEIFAGPASPKTNGGGTKWDLGADEFDGIPDNTDRISPNLAYVSILPAAGQCAPSTHTIRVRASDASGIDTVSIAYSVNNVKQTDIIMTATTTPQEYEGVIPVQNAGATVRFRVTAMDFSVNKNKYTIGGVNAVDSSFSDADFSIQASTQFDTVSTGSTTKLTASISDKIVGSGTLVYTYTTAANVFDRYYGGRRAQYLYTANELLAAGMRPGKITKIAFETGQPAPKPIALPGFRVDMGQTSLKDLSNTYVATTQVVNYAPPTGFKPEPKNGRLTIDIPAANQITWDGVSNVVVGILWSVGDAGTAFTDTTQSFRPKYSNTTNTSVIYTQADNQDQNYFISTVTSGTTTNTRPNIIFGNDYNFKVKWAALTPTGAGVPSNDSTKILTVKPTVAGTFNYVATGRYTYGTQTCSFLDTVAVTVLQAVKPAPDFVINDSTVNNGSDAKNVVFTDLTVNYPSKWKWTITPKTYTFANGTTANRFTFVGSTDSSKSPEVMFNYAGTYTVKLVASNAAGADSVVKTNLIRVDSTFCKPTYLSSSSIYAIRKVVMKNLRNTSSSSAPWYVNYGDSTNIVIPQLNIGVRDSIIVQGTNVSSQVAVWMDFNNNAIFETSELVDRAPIPAGTDSNILFYTVPQNASLGKIRMRVVSYYSTAVPNPCIPYSSGYYGEVEDYLVEVLPSLQMNITSNVATQNTTPISQGSLNQQVIKYTINTSGIANSISLTKLNLNLAGTTNIADIKRIRVYSTIGSDVYKTDSLFASTTSITGSTLTLTGTYPKGIVAGANNFWVAVDLTNSATIGNTIDVSVDSITYRRPNGTSIVTTTVATPNGTATGSRTVQAQMQITSDVISQPVTISVTPGTNDNAMMLIKLSTTTGSPANLVSMKFTSTGSTNAGTDLQGARIYYTGTSSAFSAVNQLGVTVTNVRDTMEFSGIQALSPGDNYFWLSYDIKAAAKVGNVIDASYYGFITQGTYDYATTVTVNNPAGNRAVDSSTCISNPTSPTTGDDIASVRVGNITRQTQTLSPVYNRTDATQSYNNYTTLAPFVIQRAIKTPIEVRTINTNFSLVQNRVSIYIDYNNNRKFDDNELISSKIIAATVNEKKMIDTVRVPISVSNGFYRMRFIVSAATAAAQPGCGTYSTGETEDYLVQLTTPPPGDYYAPQFSNLVVSPSASQCVATPRTISVDVTDTTGIDTVWMDWNLNNQKQAAKILVKTSGNTYSTTLPAYATLPVDFKFRALDLGTPYRNNSAYAGGKYEDEYLQVSAGKDKFIKTGDSTVLTAGSKALSNLLISDIVQFRSAAAEVYPSYIGTSDDDFIEISNISNGNADISGYTLRIIGQANSGQVDFTFTIPSGAIVPSGQVAVLSWISSGVDHVNRYYGMGLPTTTSSIYAMGYILKTPGGQIVDVVGTNSYAFDASVTGVTPTDWTGNIASSSNGVVRTANSDNNLASDFTPSVTAGPTVTIGTFNSNLPIVPSTVAVSWTGGLISGTKVGASVSTPVHPTSGTYTYVVKIDDNTCIDRDTVLVRVLDRPVVNLGPDGSICTGTRILDAGAVPYAKYLWSTGETTRQITVATPDLYWVRVTDSAKQVVRDSIDLLGGPAFIAQLGPNRDLCIGGNITLSASITGGTSMNYIWSTGATTPTLNVNAAGTYSVIVTNQLGCMSFDTIVVTQLQTNPVVNLGPDQTICKSSPSTLDAGNAGSTYLWSTGETTQTMTASNAGSYSVIVNTPTGCTLFDTVTITNLPAAVVALGADQEVCPGSTTTIDAGNPGLTYLWSTGATTQTITVGAGTYSVAVTNASGCVSNDTIVVTNKVAPVVTLGADLNICTSDTVTLDAGNAGSNYLWSTGATTRTIRVSNAGTYSVTVTSAVTGCTATDAVVVTNKAVPVSTHHVVIANGQSVTFIADVQVGLQYAWNFGDPTSAANTSQLLSPTHQFTTPGIFNVSLTVTNLATGCKSTTVVPVTVTSVGSEMAEFFKLGAAPNPFVEKTAINYTLPQAAQSVTLEVYDMVGRKIASIIEDKAQDAGDYQFNFKNEELQTSSGIYIVKLTVDGVAAHSRIIDIAKK